MLIKRAFLPFSFSFLGVKSVTNLVTLFSSFRLKDSAPELSQVLPMTCDPGSTSSSFRCSHVRQSGVSRQDSDLSRRDAKYKSV